MVRKTIIAASLTLSAFGLAGCSSDNDPTPPQPSPTQAPATATPEQMSPEATEASPNTDFARLLDGVTYKGKPLPTSDKSDVDEYLRNLETAKKENSLEDVKVEPAECENLIFRSAGEKYDLDKITRETMALVNMPDDGLSVIAYDRGIADDPLQNVHEELAKCPKYTYEVQGNKIASSIEKAPLDVAADDSYAVIQTVDVGGGVPPQEVYNSVAVKKGVMVSVHLSSPSDEAIQEAQKTLTMILDKI